MCCFCMCAVLQNFSQQIREMAKKLETSWVVCLAAFCSLVINCYVSDTLIDKYVLCMAIILHFLGTDALYYVYNSCDVLQLNIEANQALAKKWKRAIMDICRVGRNTGHFVSLPINCHCCTVYKRKLSSCKTVHCIAGSQLIIEN